MPGRASTPKETTSRSSRHARRSRIRGRSRMQRKVRISSPALILLLFESVCQSSFLQSDGQCLLKHNQDRMEPSRILNVTLSQYSPETECYIVSEYLLPKLAPNHIFAKDKANPPENAHDTVHPKQKEKKVRLIYAQQMLYLTFIAEYQQFHVINPKATRLEWQTLKKQDIITIYANLSQTGYNKLEFVQFYLKIRKKSRLIQRQYSPNDHQLIPSYRIYKTVEDFKQKVKGELTYLVQPSESIENIVRNKEKYYKEGSIKMQVLSNLDGMGVVLKPSFAIVDNKSKIDDN